MEWVEVQADTLEAAKERALDKLGVALDDAEFEIVQVPESRWLGLKKTEARVRARVRPSTPRPKKETRTRRRRGSEGSSSGGSSGGREGGSRRRDERSRDRNRSAESSEVASSSVAADEVDAAVPANRGGESGTGSSSSRSRNRNRNRNRNRSGDDVRANAEAGDESGDDTEVSAVAAAPESQQQRSPRPQTPKEAVVTNDAPEDLVPADEQQEMVVDFLTGLVDAFGLSAEIGTSVEDDTVTADVRGSGLGVLVGPKGGTIRALQEVTRAAAQRHADGRDTMRINVDVAGYRERRREALTGFALKQAEVVKAEGRRVAFEPMGSADRKIVHDAILEVDGVRSISEGDEPRRRVVLLPDND